MKYFQFCTYRQILDWSKSW